MITEIEAARAGEITPAVMRVASTEGIDPADLSVRVAEGRVSQPAAFGGYGNLFHLGP